MNANNIKKAIVFSTSWISKHSVDLLKKELTKKNIDVSDEYIYYKNKPKINELKEAEKNVEKLLKKEV